MKTCKPFNSFLKSILFCFLLLNLVASKAQLSGTYHIPSDYSTLATAIADLNSQGVSAAVTIVVDASSPQTAPAGGYVIGGAGSALLTSTSAVNTVTINGGGNIVTAFTPQTVGALNDAIFKLIGADYITLTEFIMIENSSNTGSTAAASQIRTEFGVALFYVSTGDGARNNTISNNDISLSRTYQNSFGIYSSVRHTDAAPTVAADITAASGSNSNLHVYTNAIHNVSYGVASIGSASLTAGLMNDGTDIGGSSAATGNTITDWGNPGTAISAYVSMTTTSYPCVYSINEFNNNVSFNSMLSANLTLPGAGTLYGVFQTYTGVNVAPQPTGTFFTRVNNNTFTLVNSPIASATGAIECVRTQNLGPASGASISISNNTVSACKILGANATSNLFRPIINISSPNVLTIDGNIIKDNELNTTTGQCQLLRNSSDVITDVFIRNNKLGIAPSGPGVCVTWTRASSANFFMLINGPGAINAQSTVYTITGNEHTGFIQVNHTGFLVGASITVGGSVNYNFNTFNLNLKNSFIIRLISESGQKPNSIANYLNNTISIANTSGGAAMAEFSLYLDAFDVTSNQTSAWNFSNNNCSNISFDGVGSDWIGVYSVAGNGKKKTASNNTFNNISCTANGIIESIIRVESGSSLFANTVSNNTISNISSAGGNITGILSTDSNLTVVGNTISNLSTSGAVVVGIDLENGTDVLVQKNKICGLTSTFNGSPVVVAGIVVGTLNSAEISNNTIGDLHATTAAGTSVYGIRADTITTSLKVYYNTVHLSGTSTGANWSASDFDVARSPYELNNNIFVNTCSPTGTGVAAAISTTDATLANFAVTSDRNNYFASTIFTNGTGPLTFASLAAYQTGVSPRDFNSFAQNPPFISTTCSNVNFLHLTAGATTSMESSGAPIGGITTDIDGQVRNASTPDIGADEFSGISQPFCTGVPTSGSINGIGNICSGSGTTLTLTGASTDIGIVYQWNSGTNSGGPYPNVLGTGTFQATGPLTVTTYYKVTITCTRPGGSSVTTGEKGVFLISLPTVTVSPTSALICLPGGSPAVLTAGGASTYTWSPSQGLSATTGSVVSANPILTTSYILTGTNVSGCTDDTTVIISVSNTPTNLIASATPTLVCNNGTSTLDVTAGLTIPSYASLYSLAASSGTFTPLTGAVHVPSIEADDVAASVPFGFTFSYEGNSYSNAFANSNGFLSLNNTGGGQNNNLATGTIRPVIAPLWDDLSGISSAPDLTKGIASYLTTGSNGSHVFTFEWLNWYWDFSAVDSSISFQVKLYEADGHIEFIYRSESATPTSASASVGLSSTLSGNFLSLSNLSVSPVVSSVIETNTISTKPSSGQIYTFTPPTPVVSYAWTPSAGLNPNAFVKSPVASLALGATVYTVTISNNGCTATATTTATKGTIPVATASSNSPVCEGGSLTLSSGGGTAYSWVGTNGFTSTLQNPIITNASLSNGGTYTVTVSEASGCSATATISVTINPVPGATAIITSSSSTICGGGLASLSTQSGINSPTYAWSATGGVPAGLPLVLNIPAINVNPQAVATTIYTYTVVVTDPGNSCTSSSSVALTVSPTLIADATELSPVTCIHTTNSIQVSATGGTLPYTGTGVFSVSGGKHFYTVTDALGCSSLDSVTVTGELLLSLPALTELCNENPPTIVLSAEGGLPPYNYTGQTTSLTAGLYSYTVTDANNCTANAQTTISFINCIIPSIPASDSGKVSTTIGSDLTQIHNNPDSIADSTNTQYVVDLGEILIEVVANMGYYDSLLVLLQTPAYGMTDLFDNGDSTLIITGFYPRANLLLLNNLPTLINAVRTYNPPINNSLAAGIAYSLGDSSINGSGARVAFKVEGEGVKVGVLSDSYNLKFGNPAQVDVNNGDLPGIGNPYNTNQVQVFSEYPYGVRSDEGRAMLQIVHDIAPKATLAFRSGFVSPGDFSDGVKELQQSGCHVIVDDVTFITEPFFKDGVVAQAVDFVKSQGVSYFTSAGNYGAKSYEGIFNPINPPTGYVGLAHNFGSGDYTQGVSLSRGLYTIVLQWEDSIYSLGQLPGALNDLDIFLVDNTGKRLFGFNRVNTGEDPMEILQFIVRSNTTANVLITKAPGNVNVRFKYIVFRGDITINEHIAGTSTLVGQANAAGSMAVGAALYLNTPAFGVDTAKIASFSSSGGTYVEGVVRNKPDFVGPNGVNTTVNFNHYNIEGDLLPNFFGTSCAAPHAAGAAALLIEARLKYYNSILSPDSVKLLLQSSASDMGSPGFDYSSGYGLIQVDSAINKFAAPKPILTKLIQDPLIIPGKLPFTSVIKGNFFKSNSKVYLSGIEIPKTFINSTTINASIPVFSGNPALQIFNPPNSSSGNDGGYSDPKFFLQAPRKSIVVTAENKTKKFGEKIPDLSATILVDGIPYQNTSYTLQNLGLDSMQINTLAINSSNIGLYLIRPSIDPLNPLDPADLTLLEQFDYVFNDAILVVNKMPIAINPRDTTLSYGDKIKQIHFNYFYDDQNIENAERSAFLSSIKAIHNFTLDTAVGFIDENKIVNGRVIESSDLDGIGFLSSGRSITNGRIVINKAQAFGTDLESTIVVEVLPESVFSYQLDSANATLAGGKAIVNGRIVINGNAMVNGRIVINGTSIANSLNINDSTNGKVVVIIDSADVSASVFDTIALRSVNLVTGFDEGTHIIVPGAFLSENFDITYGLGTLTIIPNELNATAKDTSRFVGDPNPVFTISYDGFKYLEDSGDIIEPVASTTALPSSPPGNYPILITGGSSNNYYFNNVNGNLTINPRLSLNVKIFIEGFYRGNGLMDGNGNGGFLYLTGVSSNPTDVDSVTISIVEPISLIEVDRQTGILQTNGNLTVSLGGSIKMGNAYYIVVRHRQSVETWSALPVTINAVTTFDFTN